MQSASASVRDRVYASVRERRFHKGGELSRIWAVSAYADHRTLSRQDSDPERNPEWSELCGVRRSVFMNMRYEQGFCGNEIRFIPTKPFFVSIGL